MFAVDFSDFGQEEKETFPILCLRERFASPDGLYSHFKYAKEGQKVSNSVILINFIV